jgi:hypothetical protein
MADRPMSPDEMVRFEEQVLHKREADDTIPASESDEVPSEPHHPIPVTPNPTEAQPDSGTTEAPRPDHPAGRQRLQGAVRSLGVGSTL